MSSRVAIQQFVSNTEPIGAALGDEWYVANTGLLYKRTAVNGTQVGWVNIAVIPSGGTTGQVLTYGTSGTLTWTTSTGGGGLISPYAGIFTITNTTTALSTTTGALQIAGGVGVGGAAYFGGLVSAGNNSVNYLQLVGANAGAPTIIRTQGTDANIQLNLQTTGFGSVVIANSSATTNTGTGALVVQGGVGIAGGAYIGGNVGIGTQGNTAASVLTVGPTNGNSGKLLTVSDHTNPTTQAGANGILVDIAGGGGIYMTQGTGGVYAKYEAYGNALGIGTMSAHPVYLQAGSANALYINTNQVVTISSNTNASGTQSGALVVVGGMGVGKDLYVGGAAYITGDLYVDGSQTFLNSTNIQTGDKVLYLSTGSTSINLAVNAGIAIGTTATPYISWLFDGISNWKSSGGIISNNTLTVLSTATAFSTTTGALIVAGGAGFGGNLYATAIYDNNSRVLTTASLVTYGVVSITGGTDTSVSTATGSVTIWDTSTLQSVTNRGATSNNAVTLNNGLTLGSTAQYPLQLTGSYSNSLGMALNATGVSAPPATSTTGYWFDSQFTLLPSTSTFNTYYGILFLPTLGNTSTYQNIYGNFSRLDTNINATGTSYVNTYVSFISAGGSKAAGSTTTLTNWYGFVSQDPTALTVTNTYGYSSQISSAVGQNKWNFYASGSAPNLFQGQIQYNTTASFAGTGGNGAVTAVLTKGADGNFQLTAQNGPVANTVGSETARFGINYAGSGWDTYFQFNRGTGAQNGAIVINGANGISVAFNQPNTQATSTSTGTLVVAGGAGIAGNIYAGGLVYSQGWQLSTSSSVGGISSPYSGIFTITNTTSAISTITGALQVIGGVGIGGNIFLSGSTPGDGGTMNGSGSLLYVKQNTTWSGNQPWALYVSGYSYLGGFRVNGQDGVRSILQTNASTDLGFATQDQSRITFVTSSDRYQFQITNTNGAWNNLGVTGAIQGQSPNIYSTGTDTTISITAIPKGNGSFIVASAATATSTGTGALVVQGGAGIYGNLYVGGNVTVLGTINANITGISSTATNLAGGTTGQLPYQSGVGTTLFVGPGTAGQILLSNGAAAPVYTNTASISVNASQYSGTATNIAAGTAGQLPYQTGAGLTGFVGTGTAGQILLSNGAAAPVYTNTASIYVGQSSLAITATNVVGGSTGAILYQSTSGQTTNLALGNNGYILVAGVNAPQWTAIGGLSAGVATTATNLANGSSGQIPFQTASGITSFFGPGTAGSILTSNGGGSPSFIVTASVYVGYSATATNIMGGTAGQLHYQTGVGQTSFAGPGTAGQILLSGGTSAPTYVNTSSVYVGQSTLANNLIGGAAGSLPYQSGLNATSLLALGTAGYVLTAGASAPQWTAIGSLSAGVATTATNLANGTTGQIPYQTSTGVTSFFGPGTAGQLLVSNGASVPGFYNTGTVHVGAAQIAQTSTFATTATTLSGGATGGIPYQSAVGTTNFIAIGTSGYVLQSNGSTATWQPVSSLSAGTSTYAVNVGITDDVATATPQYITFVSVSSGYTPVKTSASKLSYVASTGVLAAPNLFLTSSAASTATTSSNALYVAGGAYINSLFVKNDAVFAGNVTFNGTATYIYSTNTVYTDNIIELHTPPGGVAANWTVDDGKDIGVRFHYYTNSTDTNAALVLANDTKFLEWYSAGAETTGSSIISSATYGTFKTGSIRLADTVNATSTNTGALQLQGGAGIARDLFVGGNITVQGSINATINGVVTSSTQIQITNDLASSTPQFLVFTAGSSGYNALKTAANTGMTYIPSSGYHGININTPTATLHVNGSHIITGVTTVTNVTASTSTVTGAFIVAGGVGVGGSINVAGSMLIANSVTATTFYGALVGTATNATTATTVSVTNDSATSAPQYIAFVSTTTGYSAVKGSNTQFTFQPSNGQVVLTGGQLSLTNATLASSTSAGALVVAGGIAAGGGIYSAGPVVSLSTVTTGLNASNFVARPSGTTSSQLTAYTFYGTFFNFPADTGPRRTADIVSGFASGTWGTEFLSLNVGYNGAANDINTTTNEIVRVTKDGIVIQPTTAATTTTGGALQVKGGVGILGNLYVGGSIIGNLVGSVSTSSAVSITNDSATSTAQYVTFVSTSSGSQGLKTNATSGLTYIASSNSLGIGVVATSTNYKLDVGGEIRSGATGSGFYNSTNNAGYWWNSYGLRYDGIWLDTTNNRLSFRKGNTDNVVIIDSNNNLGLGTTAVDNSAGYKTFSVGGVTGGQITWQNGTTYKGFSYNDATNMIHGSQAALIFMAGGATEGGRFDANRNFMVGTSATAQGRVTIQGGTIAPATVTSYALTVGNINNNDLSFGSDASYAYIQSWNSKPLSINNQGNNTILNLAGGNVGVGVTPSGTLHVYAAAGTNAVVQDATAAMRFVTASGVNYIQAGTSLATSAAPLVFGGVNAGIEYARFTSVGNFGLGIASATANFHNAGGSLLVGLTTSSNSTNATSTVTGAVQVVGGVGIGRDLYVGGNVTVLGTINANITGISNTATNVGVTNDAASSTPQYITFVSTTTGYANIKGLNSQLVFTPSTGALSLGTQNSAGKLTVVGSAITIGTQGTYAATFGNSTSDVSIGSDGTNGYIQTFNSKVLQLNNQGNNIVTNLNGGNLGIGVAPGTKLHVQVATTGTDGLYLTSSVGGGNVYLRPNNSSGANNGITQAGDAGIIYSSSAGIGTGAFVIAPWYSGTSGMRFDSSGTIYMASGAPASSTQTGALRILGGLGVGGSIYAGNIYSNGTLLTGGGGGGGSSVTISDTAPASPSTGNLWWDSTIGQMFIYYADGTSNQWVPANPGLQGPAGATGAQGIQGPAGPAGVNSGTTATFIITDTTQAVSTITGALQVRGGAGIGGNIWAGGSVVILGTTNAVNTATGSLIVPFGGASVAKDFFAGTLYSNAGVYAVGSIYANYSDIRLKDIVGQIEDPITKICSIDTFYYTPNALAVSLGVTEIHQQVGLSAQSVQAIMPEAVGPSPLDKDYLTVQYERLVPLLIESIKKHEAVIQDLQLQVKTLQAKIGQ